jgi:hypothetical protein
MSKKEVKRRCSCGADIQFAFTADFQIGSSGHDLKMLFPEVSETTLPLNVFICPKCAKISLFVGDAIKSTLLRLAKKHNQ